MYIRDAAEAHMGNPVNLVKRDTRGREWDLGRDPCFGFKADLFLMVELRPVGSDRRSGSF